MEKENRLNRLEAQLVDISTKPPESEERHLQYQEEVGIQIQEQG